MLPEKDPVDQELPGRSGELCAFLTGPRAAQVASLLVLGLEAPPATPGQVRLHGCLGDMAQGLCGGVCCLPDGLLLVVLGPCCCCCYSVAVDHGGGAGGDGRGEDGANDRRSLCLGRLIGWLLVFCAAARVRRRGRRGPAWLGHGAVALANGRGAHCAGGGLSPAGGACVGDVFLLGGSEPDVPEGDVIIAIIIADGGLPVSAPPRQGSLGGSWRQPVLLPMQLLFEGGPLALVSDRQGCQLDRWWRSLTGETGKAADRDMDYNEEIPQFD